MGRKVQCSFIEDSINLHRCCSCFSLAWEEQCLKLPWVNTEKSITDVDSRKFSTGKKRVLQRTRLLPCEMSHILSKKSSIKNVYFWRKKKCNGHYMSQKIDTVIFWCITRRGANNKFVSMLQYSYFTKHCGGPLTNAKDISEVYSDMKISAEHIKV